MELHITPKNGDIGDMYTKLIMSETETETPLGFNLFFVNDQIVPPNQKMYIDLEIKCSLRTLNDSVKIKSMQLFVNKNFWIIPNDFLARTTLLSVTNPLPIKSDENKNIIVCVYNYSVVPYTIKKGLQLFQLISPDLNDITKVIIH